MSLFCEVLTRDDSTDCIYECDENATTVVDYHGEHALACDYHVEIDGDKLPIISRDETEIARVIALREWRNEWAVRSSCFCATKGTVMWDELHNSDCDDPIITASSAANIFNLGYLTRKKYFDSFFGKKAEISNYARLIMQRGGEMEHVAIASLMSRISSCYEIFGIDVEQRTFRGYNNTYFLGATPDGVIRTDDGDFIIEVKCPSGVCPTEPRAGHVIQTMLQMFLFRFMYEPSRRIRKAMLFYWTPEATRLFQITYIQDVMNALFLEIDTFRQQVLEKRYEVFSAKKQEKILDLLKRVIV